ncbi:MAG: radical SAM family heme chaperone HemW, partial [Planctomycetota bacterium]
MIFIKDASPKALYIHIPFCVKRCNYCDFNSTVSASNTIDRYLDAVEREFETLKDRYLFHTVYIGGGTPTVLNEFQLERLLDSAIHYGMVSDNTKEFTVEANPATLTETKARLLKERLVNRISMGVQSFQDKHLKTLGRIHTGDDAKDTFALLRRAGFHNINIDLIFGCPGQTLDDWEKDLEAAIGLNPEHVSTYALTYEDETPLARDMQNKVISKLDESVELEMYKTAITYGTNNGYNHYEISNFAKSGYECLHNYFYWKNLSYAGVGAGAFSFINGVRTAHEKNVLSY